MSQEPVPVQINVRIVRSNRKTIEIRIDGPGRVLVRAPRTTPEAEIRRVVESREAWILAHLEKEEARAKLPKLSRAEVEALAKQARAEIPPRVHAWAARLGVTYGRITIRSQHTRWGSCSAKGNLNFNCMLMRCPESVVDYIIVHELCHRKELNHSYRFWAEVERVMPDHRVAERWLRTNGQALINSLP